MSATLDQQQSISKKIEAAFPFSVDKFPLTGPEGLHTPHYGLFRGDDGQCIGVACRKTYVPHTVDDVAALAEAASAAFSGECDVRCHWNDGHFVSIIPPLEYRKAIFGTKDNIFPRLMIRAGYDGRAFRGELGFYRDCCRNMAILRQVSGTARVSDSIKHTHHLRERLEDLQRVFSRLAAGWDGVAETAQRLETREVDLAQFLRTVYPMPEDASSRTRGTHDRRVEKIIRRVVRERVATGRPELKTFGRTFMVSAWEALNGVQGYVQHDMPRHGRPGEMERALLALDDAAVSRALEVALAA